MFPAAAPKVIGCGTAVMLPAGPAGAIGIGAPGDADAGSAPPTFLMASSKIPIPLTRSPPTWDWDSGRGPRDVSHGRSPGAIPLMVPAPAAGGNSPRW